MLVERSANCLQFVLVACGAEAADEVAEPRAGYVEVEEASRCVSRHRERVHDRRRDEHPRLGAHDTLLVLEPERELALEDEEAFGVPCVGVQRRNETAGLRPNLDQAELLEVGEQGNARPAALIRDALAFADLDHGGAA